MVSGLIILVFAIAYAVALALEVARFLFRTQVHGPILFAVAGSGFLAHTVFLVRTVLEFYQSQIPNASPLSSKQDWYFVAAWVLVVIYLYLTYYHPRTSFGLVFLPLILATVAIAALVADPHPFPREPASKVWGLIHGASLLVASVAVFIGFAAGLVYLRQATRLKNKVPAQKGVRLPSLEWLQKTNSRAITVALIMLAMGILSGMILNLTRRTAGEAFLPWNDPVVLSTLVMFGWLLVSSGVSLVYRPAREGKKVAYLTVVSFVFLVIALAVVLSKDTRHGGVQSRLDDASAAPKGQPFAQQWPTLVCEWHGQLAHGCVSQSTRGGRA
jgi:ABC-type uncharacterized transport system permease subunit